MSDGGNTLKGKLEGRQLITRGMSQGIRCPPEVLLRQANRADMIWRPVSGGNDTYRAMVCTELGKPLQLQRLNRGNLEDGEVRLEAHNTGINFSDILMVQGKYQEKPQLPFVPGAEVAGVVTELGPGVTDLAVGDRVFGMAHKGAYAEEVIGHSAAFTKLPGEIPHKIAASFMCTYCTAWMALTRRANIKEGDTVLVTAAAGGVGLAAVDLAANVFKAKVIGACGSDEKCRVVLDKGAVACINYNKESIRDRMKELTEGNGADIILDAVGGDCFNQCLRSIAFEGRIVVIGFASGDIPKIPANILLVKSCSAVGVYWGSYRFRLPQAFFESADGVTQALTQGLIKPHVSATFPLDQTDQAFQYILDRKSTGKVVVDLRK